MRKSTQSQANCRRPTSRISTEYVKPLPDRTQKLEKIGWRGSVFEMRNFSVRARSRRRLISSSSVVRQLCGEGTAVSGDACFGMVGMIGIARAESKRTCPKLFTAYSQWTTDVGLIGMGSAASKGTSAPALGASSGQVCFASRASGQPMSGSACYAPVARLVRRQISPAARAKPSKVAEAGSGTVVMSSPQLTSVPSPIGDTPATKSVQRPLPSMPSKRLKGLERGAVLNAEPADSGSSARPSGCQRSEEHTSELQSRQ